MIVKHQDKNPEIDQTVYIAPNALICGNVTIGKNSRIMFGAQIIAENSSVSIGDNCIVLENAVIRGTDGHSVTIGESCLIGPHSHLAGCTIEDNVFIATGASIFHGALIKKGAEVRINGVVHIKTVIPENETVPIGWVAVGNPMKLFSPDKHNEIWEIQKPLNFPEFVYGLPRKENTESMMLDICKVMYDRLSEHKTDLIINDKATNDTKGKMPPNNLPVYRLLTGPDDSTFCERVSEALSMGYKLCGSPAATFNGEHMIVAQAIIWSTFE
jgi:carbonic anhydrase/acetyltransferase-like protein (isoleucine patch superfamily)